MGEFRFYEREIHDLTRSLEEVSANAGLFIRDGMERTAIDIRDDWRAAASGMRGLRAYPRSIGYDFTGFQGFGATNLTCEIGPDKGRKQGSFGAIVEYGAPNFAPRHYGDNALDAHEAQFEQLMTEALEKAERALTFGGAVRGVLTGRLL